MPPPMAALMVLPETLLAAAVEEAELASAFEDVAEYGVVYVEAM